MIPIIPLTQPFSPGLVSKPLQMAAKRGREPQYDQLAQICEQPISRSTIFSPVAILHNLCPIFITIQSLLGATQYLEHSGFSIFTELNTNLKWIFTSSIKIIYTSIYYHHILNMTYLTLRKFSNKVLSSMPSLPGF